MIDYAGPDNFSCSVAVATECILDELVREYNAFTGTATVFVTGQNDHGGAELIGGFLVSQDFER
jgi:hypothetical protein